MRFSPSLIPLIALVSTTRAFVVLRACNGEDTGGGCINWQGTLPLWIYGWGGDANAAKHYRPYITTPVEMMPIFSFTFEDPRQAGVRRNAISFFPNVLTWPCLSLARLQSLELKATRNYLKVPSSGIASRTFSS